MYLPTPSKEASFFSGISSSAIGLKPNLRKGGFLKSRWQRRRNIDKQSFSNTQI